MGKREMFSFKVAYSLEADILVILGSTIGFIKEMKKRECIEMDKGSR
jgi:hypothetical protein